MRVSGGHLCAEHRSTDRGGSRELDSRAAALGHSRLSMSTRHRFTTAPTYLRHPRQSRLLRCPKFLCALERHRNFDRCAIFASLHRPQDALWRQCPKQAACFARNKKSSNLSVTAFTMVEATGLDSRAAALGHSRL